LSTQINSSNGAMEEEDYAEAFNHYAKNSRLGPHELRELMKYLGYNPTDSEIKALMRREGAGSGIDAVDYNDFCRIMREQVNNVAGDEHLIQCFSVLDRVDNGYVSAAEFRHLMLYVSSYTHPPAHLFGGGARCSTLGDRFTEDEVDELLREAEIDSDGQFNYREFVKNKMSG